MIFPPERFIVEIGCISKATYGNLALWNAGLLRLLGYQETDSVLDLGCGCGRLLAGLDGHGGGSYLGVDQNAEYVEWCAKSYPKHEFRHVPEFKPDPLNLPDKVDWIVAHSFFTHTDEETTIHYLDEIARYLRGKAFLTFAVSEQHNFTKGRMIQESKARMLFYWSRPWLDREFARRNLKPLYLRGNWQDGYGFWSQDVVILEPMSTSV